MARLSDRVVIVTGGAQGIGWAYCQALAREGAKVVVADIDGTLADKAAAELKRQGNEAIAVKTDVSQTDATEAMVKATAERFGRIDGLVNNAAIFQRPSVTRGPFEQISVEEWDRVMAVNVRGSFLCCRAVLPHMKQRKYGKIVNISSGTVIQGTPGFVQYVTSKAAVIGLTRSMAREVGNYNICVNAVAPGLTLSLDNVDEAGMKQYEVRAQSACIKRIEKPEDLVGTIVFLCSGESDFITGQTIAVNGGSAML
ncbi:MAG TPA: 3-oxoacyl-ACP reductase family protein [Candidatus Binatia bacterium]